MDKAVIDEDDRPLPARPWEPPGPQPKRRLTDAGRMFVAIAIVAVAFLALALLIFMPSPYGVSPG